MKYNKKPDQLYKILRPQIKATNKIIKIIKQTNL